MSGVDHMEEAYSKIKNSYSYSYYRLIGSYKSRIKKDAPGSSDNIDTVRPMEQTHLLHPGIQLSRGGKPRLRRTQDLR